MATVTDPVCGMDIDPDTAPAHEDYRGTTYHFCSAACHKEFHEAPDKYVV